MFGYVLKYPSQKASKMAEIDLPRYNELCRLCAAKTTMLLAVNIFHSDGIVGQLSKKIESCLSLQVNEDDDLPKMVCENCLCKLNLLSDFKDRTICTEKLLLDLFKELHHDKLVTPNHLSVDEINHELMLVENQQMLSSNSIEDVHAIELNQLHQRERIVSPGIILTGSEISINSQLTNISFDHHDATSSQNHNLSTENLLLEDSRRHNMEGVRLSNDNVNLIRHEQLFTLEHNPTHDIGEIELNDEIHNSISHSKLEHLHDDIKYHIQNTNIQYGNEALNSIKDCKKESTGKELHTELNNTKETFTPMSMNKLDEIYSCNICGKTCEDESRFDEHYATHFLKCGVCECSFVDKKDLHKHNKEVHADDSAQMINETDDNPETKIEQSTENYSDDSGAEYVDEPDPLEYEQAEDNLGVATIEKNKKAKKIWAPKVCTECGKTYKTNYKLTEHMRKHTGEKPYKCSSCDKEFRSKIGLAQHAAKHTGKYDYACMICGKGFQIKSYLMVHQRVHSDVKPYPCTTCGRNFKTKQSLLDHTNRHLGVKPFMCEICGRSFITKGLCKTHQKVHTGLDNRKYSCKVCSKMFVSKSYLQTHLRIHTGEKPFICEVCGKGFLTKVDLRIHNTMHTGEKSFVCEMCGKAFARRDALRCHRRSHTGERPYSCDLCGQTFTQFTPMAIHKRLHTGERPYACESCGKTFVSRSTMMSHAKKHLR